MKLIQRTEIDTRRWDQKIAQSGVENVFLYSWYLDAVCPNWAALVTENYNTLLPVPYTTKLGVKQFIQAPFTREYDIVGAEFGWNDALAFLAGKFKSIHFRNEQKGILKGGKKRMHQWINLTEDFQQSYSTNAKRILKKKSAFQLVAATNPVILLNLFKEHVAPKIESISAADLVALEQLMKNSLKNRQGELLLVLDGNETVAGGFFLSDKKRITYLKGAATDAAKKEGAMYFLIDQAMRRYEGNYATFDFGGSDIEAVAGFYHKFGAADRIYYDYVSNDLPFWFKTLKKIKR